MKRLIPLLAATFVLVGLAAPGSRRAQATPSTPQNIVFIISDDETYAEAQPASTNVNLNTDIGAKGITFTNAIIPNPLCCPSRTSILRGQFSSKTGVWTNTGPFGGWGAAQSHGDENSTIATWLQADGYRTGLVGKYLNGYGRPWTVPPGWDYWRGEDANDADGGYYDYYISNQGKQQHFGSKPADYSVDVMTNFATSFISSTPAAQPLFLYVGYRAPHYPRTPAPRYLNDPRCNGAVTTGLPDYGIAGTGAPHYLTTLTKPKADAGTKDPQQACRSLLAVDDGIGSIVDALRVSGRLADTLLVFISDNGYMYGEHKWIAKRVPYESSIHVPMLIRDDALIPRADRGSTNSSVVANVDLAPTAADVSGITPPLPEDGASLMSLLGGSTTLVRSGILLEGYSPDITPPMPSYCGWRTPRYSFAEYTTGERTLYDLQNDPYEMTNLVGQPGEAAITASMQSSAETACTPRPPDWP